MGLKNLDIKRSYISYGDDNIPKAFLVPALRYAKSYQRSVGFFSSSVFLPIMDGIVSLFRNGGKIQLIASPQLSEEDIQAINLGYEKRDKVITDAATRDFMSSFQEFDEVKLQLLVDLIASGTLDIKIATLTSVGIYHDKLGIIKDFEGNAIVFFGSANSSINAYQNNYEKIRVVKSWDETENDVIEEEENEFESLWQGKNPYVNVLSYSESAKENLITIIANDALDGSSGQINHYIVTDFVAVFFLYSGTLLLFFIRQVAVGLDHQVDILFHLRPFQGDFLVVRVMVKFQSLPVVVHKTPASVQKIVGVPTNAVLLCQCFGTEFSVRLGLVQCHNALLATCKPRTMLTQFVLNFCLRQNKSGGRFLALRSVNLLNLLGFGGKDGIQKT